MYDIDGLAYLRIMQLLSTIKEGIEILYLAQLNEKDEKSRLEQLHIVQNRIRFLETYLNLEK